MGTCLSRDFRFFEYNRYLRILTLGENTERLGGARDGLGTTCDGHGPRDNGHGQDATDSAKRRPACKWFIGHRPVNGTRYVSVPLRRSPYVGVVRSVSLRRWCYVGGLVGFALLKNFDLCPWRRNFLFSRSFSRILTLGPKSPAFLKSLPDCR